MLSIILLSVTIGWFCILIGYLLRSTRYLDVNPRYRTFLKWHGLSEVEDFLSLPAVLVNGHAHRNLGVVVLGRGASPLRAYLKREQRVYWRDYWTSALAGFGFVARTCREAQTLRALRQAGVSCPEVIAAGQDGQGRAFLLVRELTGCQELRAFLRGVSEARPGARRLFARKLGETLARIHAAGFVHGDLYAPHLLVDRESLAIHVVDWQRSRRRKPTLRSRWQELAALDATLADQLATPRERLACLHAYLESSRRYRGTDTLRAPLLATLRQARAEIVERSRRLQRKRYVRELRETSLAIGTQTLVCVDGRTMYVTGDWHRALEGRTPQWLEPAPEQPAIQDRLSWEEVRVPGARNAMLVRRRSTRPWRWLWSLLRGRPFTAPEVQQAATLFRLQRFGVETPRLLAFGQRHALPWQTESLLLTEQPATRQRLTEWLVEQTAQQDFTAEHKRRRHVLFAAGAVLRRMHDACCYLDSSSDDMPFFVQTLPGGKLTVVLGEIARLQSRRKPSVRRTERDLRHVGRLLLPLCHSQTDVLFAFRAYTGEQRLSAKSRRLLQSLVTELEVAPAEGIATDAHG